MPEITVRINQRPYKLACAEGQEERLAKLATYLDQKVSDLAAKAAPGTGPSEAQLLVIASLMIADELGEAYDELQSAREAPAAEELEARLAGEIDAVAARIEAMASIRISILLPTFGVRGRAKRDKRNFESWW